GRPTGGDHHGAGTRVHGRTRPAGAGGVGVIRRLCGPWGGACTFALVAALVIGGLGWVTAAALKVEAAQRESAAQAAQSDGLRVALWRLDASLFTPLGLEDARPYQHYAPVYAPFNFAEAGEAAAVSQLRLPSPLLSAALPEWM